MPAIVNGACGNYAATKDGMDTTVGFMSVGKPMGAHYLSAGLGVIHADWQGLRTACAKRRARPCRPR